MHYCTLVFTKEFPTHEILEEKMKPFDENQFYANCDDDGNLPEDTVYPMFLWDYWLIGGRYNGLLQMKFEDKFIKCNDTRNGRDFHSYPLEKIKDNYKGEFPFARFDESDFLGLMGMQYDLLLVDSCKISQLTDQCIEKTVGSFDKVGYNIVSINGYAYSRGYWNGDSWIDQEETYVKRFDEFWNECKEADGYVTVIDIHD